MRNTTLYRGRFSGLKLEAFGIHSVLAYETDIELYQARVSPELWRSRPMFKTGAHRWQASTAEALQAMISADFEVCITPWAEAAQFPVRTRPTLRQGHALAGQRLAG